MLLLALLACAGPSVRVEPLAWPTATAPTAAPASAFVTFGTPGAPAPAACADAPRGLGLLLVTVAVDHVSVAGSPVAALDHGQPGKEGVTAVGDALVALRKANEEAIALGCHPWPDPGPPARVLLAADARVPGSTVAEVIANVGAAGYREVDLVVDGVPKDGGGATTASGTAYVIVRGDGLAWSADANGGPPVYRERSPRTLKALGDEAAGWPAKGIGWTFVVAEGTSTAGQLAEALDVLAGGGDRCVSLAVVASDEAKAPVVTDGAATSPKTIDGDDRVPVLPIPVPAVDSRQGPVLVDGRTCPPVPLPGATSATTE